MNHADSPRPDWPEVPPGRAEVRFDYEEHRLDNGLRVILHEDRGAPIAAVHLMYHVGSKDEQAGRTGFAHLFEHLLFQGSEHVGDDEHFKLIQNAGGTLNGSTWFDRTNYFETVPSSHLDLALWLESDRMGFFAPSITQEKLDNQRAVVKNERRQAYENQPYGLAFETVLRLAFPEGHPYRHPTIGFMEDLDAATLANVHEFFDLYYGPNNAVLVLAGDFEAADALRRAERYFGEIPSRPRPDPVEVEPPAMDGERREAIFDRVHVPRVYIMYHAPSFNSPEFEASDLLAHLLADGKSSRLHHDLIYDKRVAGEVHAFTWPTESVGMFFLIATARPGVSAPTLEAAMLESVADLRERGLEEAEVAGARNRARRALVQQLNGVGERADAFAHAAVLRGDPGYVNDAFGRYRAVTTEGCERLAGELFTSRRRVVLHVVPEQGKGASA
ncbi:MAG: insulinase family protein [Gemmatimonadota bacterium]|nr:MAG: insulinase family protein [Gemmatimonadota bacterium]